LAHCDGLRRCRESCGSDAFQIIVDIVQAHADPVEMDLVRALLVVNVKAADLGE